MRIGVPKEIKNQEHRVGLTPESVSALSAAGHAVCVETQAGAGIGAADAMYQTAGARIAETADEVFESSDLIVKVKEPQAVERARLRPGQTLFTYLHLSADPAQANDLKRSGAVAIAYETITAPTGGLPLLKPMSQVAGRLSVQAGAAALEKSHGGRGVLLGGVPGVAPGRATIIGGGVVGEHAALMAVGLGADVTILDRDLGVLERLDARFGGRVKTRHSTPSSLWDAVVEADLVVGAVLVPGSNAPKLVTRDMVRAMNAGSVLVDVAIDQGGCFETSRATTHDDPTYMVDDVVHYCVANMPGAVARTSTYALNAATLPFVQRLADAGWRAALSADSHFKAGLTVAHGRIAHAAVAADLGEAAMDADAAIAQPD